jgi:hypothetical protein
MEIILIDVGALALFLGYVAIVYWHAVLGETHRREPRVSGEPRRSAGPRKPAVPSVAGRV